tara:strand:+ start:163 stop:453 length:291 start_codon:yes stop_codon:yes gene_type:complete
MKPNCEHIEQLQDQFSWYNNEKESIKLMPHFKTNMLRVNFCPVCGEDCRDVQIDLKDYDKLFKELYGEDKREGSVYPSLLTPEVTYHNGEWVKVKN